MPDGNSMKPWSPDNSRSESQQPDISSPDVRLQTIAQVGRTVMVTLSSGQHYELDVDSVPTDLPEAGEPLPGDLLQSLEQAQARKLAARDLMTMLGRSLQPMARLRRKLRDKGHSEAIADQVLALMQEKGLCSDRQYAEAYCRDTLLVRAVGPRYLVSKLNSRQIPLAVAKAAVSAILLPERESELALQAAAARWRRSLATRDKSAVAKVVKFLMGRGFSAQVSWAAARQMRPEIDSGENGDGYEDPGDRL